MWPLGPFQISQQSATSGLKETIGQIFSSPLPVCQYSHFHNDTASSLPQRPVHSLLYLTYLNMYGLIGLDGSYCSLCVFSICYNSLNNVSACDKCSVVFLFPPTDFFCLPSSGHISSFLPSFFLVLLCVTVVRV